MLLPPEARERERQYWYRGADDEVMQYLTLPRFERQLNLAIEYQTNDEKGEVLVKDGALLSADLSSIIAEANLAIEPLLTRRDD